MARVRIALGHPSSGWVLLALLSNTRLQHATITCSDVYCPFRGLAQWLRRIRAGDIPAVVEIDEESATKRLVALPDECDADRFWLVVLKDEVLGERDLIAEEDVILRCNAHRSTFVHDFASECARWIKEDLVPAEWCARSLVGWTHRSRDISRSLRYLRRLDFADLAETTQPEKRPPFPRANPEFISSMLKALGR